MSWLDTAEGIITLVITGLSLLAAIPSVYFGFKSLFKNLKDKSAQDIWKAIETAADTAMETVEQENLDGADKKELVIETVKKTLQSQGVDISDFLDQLSAYIDDCVEFANRMNSK